MSAQFLRWKLWSQWKDAVGEQTATLCEPVHFHKGVLWIYVKSSVWMQELIFCREELQKKINAWAKRKWVVEIKLTTDRRSIPSDPDQQSQLKDQIGKFK